MSDENVIDTKYIYFVRHGETRSNLEQLVQPPTSELNETGFSQAERMAGRGGGLDVSVVISSEFKRAWQTADVIAARNGWRHETSSLFHEVLRPSVFSGLPRTDPAYQEYVKNWNDNVTDPTWHFSDEESVQDVFDRSREAVQFLKERPEPHILVVTHGLFLKYIVSDILLGPDADPRVRLRFHDKIYPTNTGLTIFKIQNGKWQMITWNDHAHLAD